MANLIHGKQLRDATINVTKLVNSGATAGFVATYESGNDQILWQALSGLSVTSINAINGVSADTSTGAVTIEARTDNKSIFVESSEITLGNPSGVINGAPAGQYTFTDNIVILGDLTVQGTATTLNTETLSVEDNLITLNSNVTAGTPTLNAGIEVYRGSADTVEFRWNETSDWWEISNPDNTGGTGATYYPILTTASVSGATNISVSVIGDGDEIEIEVIEANLSGIPNSALTDNSITIDAGEGLGGGGLVALGGTVTVSAKTDGVTIQSTGDTLNVIKVPNALTINTDSVLTASTTTFDGSGPVSFGLDLTTLDSLQDTYVTGGTITTTPDENSESGVITLNYKNDDGGTYTLPFENIFVTGGTLTGSDLVLDRNDGTPTATIDLSALDVNDTFATGTTNLISATTSNNDQTFEIVGNDGFSTITATTYDTFVSSGSYSLGAITFTRNDSSTFQVSGLDSTDSFATGTTNFVSATTNNHVQSIDIEGNNAFTAFTLSLENTYITGGTSDANGTVTLSYNDPDVTGTLDLTLLDVNDTFATGTNNFVTATKNSDTQSIDLTGNTGFGTITITTENTFVTGGTISNGSLTLDLNDGTDTTTNITGTIIQSVSGDSPITASTTNGAVTVGLDYTSLQLAVQTTDDKSQFMSGALSGGTTGNSSDTEIIISNTPINDSYVKVEVNGVGYEVLGTTAGDSYFSSDACSTAVAITSIDPIVSGNTWCWNGGIVGFELDSNDRIDFFYNVLQ